VRVFSFCILLSDSPECFRQFPNEGALNCPLPSPCPLLISCPRFKYSRVRALSPPPVWEIRLLLKFAAFLFSTLRPGNDPELCSFLGPFICSGIPLRRERSLESLYGKCYWVFRPFSFLLEGIREFSILPPIRRSAPLVGVYDECFLLFCPEPRKSFCFVFFFLPFSLLGIITCFLFVPGAVPCW